MSVCLAVERPAILSNYSSRAVPYQGRNIFEEPEQARDGPRWRMRRRANKASPHYEDPTAKAFRAPP